MLKEIVKCDNCGTKCEVGITDYPCQYCDGESGCILCRMDKFQNCGNEYIKCDKCGFEQLV